MSETKGITISQAFKLKNKFIKEIDDIKMKIRRSNSYVTGAVVHYDAKELYSKLATRKADLIVLKSKIIKANVVVYPKIYELAELKDQINLLKGLNTSEGKETRRGYGVEPVEEVIVAVINQPTVDSEVVRLEDKIELLQEELDTHNYTTYLDFAP